jgi:hypothetical protein
MNFAHKSSLFIPAAVRKISRHVTYDFTSPPQEVLLLIFTVHGRV